MRRFIFIVMSGVCTLAPAPAPAIAQSAGHDAIPREIGNRANGFSYQPTPGRVRPLEMAAGVRPSGTRQATTGQELEDLDRSLLLSEGLGTASVPGLRSGR